MKRHDASVDEIGILHGEQLPAAGNGRLTVRLAGIIRHQGAKMAQPPLLTNKQINKIVRWPTAILRTPEAVFSENEAPGHRHQKGVVGIEAFPEMANQHPTFPHRGDDFGLFIFHFLLFLKFCQFSLFHFR